MADDVDEESKTEQPSGRRTSQAYSEGNMPIGRDAIMVASLAAGVLALLTWAARMSAGLLQVFESTFRRLGDPSFRDFITLAAPVGLQLIALLAMIAVGSTAATMAQTGAGLWPEKVLPDFSRMGGISKVFHFASKDFAIDFGITLLKVAVIVWAGWSVLGPEFDKLPRIFDLPPAALLPALFEPASRAMLRMLLALGALAAGDFFLQRWRFNKQMRMTKEEAKREFRDEEGDPQIKGRRRRKARELVKQRARQEVPKADVLVVNPTHLAIAIRYRKDEGAAPRVTAKGEGPVAQLMRDLARDNSVPIVQDVPLARLLYKRVKVGNAVPEQTYRAVAAILVFVYKITGRRPD